MEQRPVREETNRQAALQEFEDLVEEIDCSHWSEDEQQALEAYLLWRRQWAAVIYDFEVPQEEKFAVAEEFPREAFQIAGESNSRQIAEKA